MLKYVLLCLIPFMLCAEEIPVESIVTPEVQYYEYREETKITNNENLIQAEVVGKRVAEGNSIGKYYGNSLVISAEQISQAQAKSIPEVLNRYAGIGKYSNGTGSDLDWTLNWRGFNKGREIVVLVDGVRVNESDDNAIYWPLLPVDSIERIEVLPGAQSAQIGSGAFGGVIAIYTKKDAQNSVRLETGSYGYGLQQLVLGVKREGFSYRLSGLQQAETGYRNHSDYVQKNFQGNFSWQLNEGLLDLEFQNAQANMNYPVQLTSDEVAFDRTDSPIHNTRNLGSTLYQGGFTGGDSDLSWTIRGGSRERKVDYVAISKSGAAGDLKTKENERSKNWLGQLTWQDNITVGYEYKLADIETESFKYDRLQNKNLNLQAKNIGTKGEYAPYAQIGGDFGSGYARYSVRSDKVDYVNYDDLAKSRQEKSYLQRSHSSEIGYKFGNLTIFSSYGEAFRAPTFSDLFRSGSIWYQANPNLLPELANTEEVGLRWQNDNYSGNWSVFDTTVEDEIVMVANPTTFISQNKNAGKTKRNGFNLNNQAVFGNYVLRGGYAYTKARFVEFEDGWGADYSGYAVPLVPEQTYNLGLGYKQDVWSVFLDHFFVGHQYMDEDNYNEEDQLAKYSYADLSAFYQVNELFNLNLKVSNLFNNLYLTKGLRWFNGSTFAWDRVYTPADLRSIRFGCEAKF